MRTLIRATVGIAAAVLIVGSIFYGIVAIPDNARSKGATDDEIAQVNLLQLANEAANTPDDESALLPDNLHSTVVYLFRWGCPDCERLSMPFLTWMRENAPDTTLYTVSSRSEQGAALKEATGLSVVPSVIYYDADGDAHAFPIYVENADGIAEFDESALATLKELIDG